MSTVPDKMPVACLVSLGCAKNLVDSERLLAELARGGFVLTSDPAAADVCLVNTCGFLRAAAEEAHSVIGELTALRGERGRPRIVALGCLVERTLKDTAYASFLKQADACVTFNNYACLPDICLGLLEGKPPPRLSRSARADRFRLMRYLDGPRLRGAPRHLGYLKLAEGCSNACAYCAIPRIRGPQISRPPSALLHEVRTLYDDGARDISLIAQDTTAYGRDRADGVRLADLLRELRAMELDAWFRLLYAYPGGLNEEVLDLLASDSRFCPYVDMPIQHIATPVLRAMGRRMTRDDLLRQLDLVRGRLPEAALRTTLLVGFPGESEAHFDALLAFVEEGHFDHLGVFRYAHEPGTPAWRRFEDTLPAAEKERRESLLMEAQRQVSRRRLARRVGGMDEIMVDSSSRTGKDRCLEGHAAWQAPEVDGLIRLRWKKNPLPRPGTRLPVRLTSAGDYHMTASPCAS